MKGLPMAMLKLIPVMLMMMLTSAGCGSPQAELPPRQTREAPADSVEQEKAAPQEDPAAPNASAGDQADAAEVGTLLDDLERGAADLTAFTARVTYDRRDELVGSTETRTGDLIYRLDPESRQKKFAILFDSLLVKNRLREESKHYIFDGRWLAEIDAKEKQFIKREIVPPGKTLDPLKLGEGPFPLPIGQPKAEVLARFDVTKAEVPQAGRLKDLKNVDGLLLVPKPNTPEAEDYAKVELFYDRQTKLPVGIHTVDSNGDHKTILLENVQRNPKLDQSQLQKLSIEEPDPKQWRIDVRPWSDG
jgi:hypothetical protein